jgi:hypothetical protein
MIKPKLPITISTLSLFAYLLTVLTWELEIVIVLIYLFTNRILDPIGVTALHFTAVALTAFSWFRGQRDFQRLRWTGGRIPITRFQGFLITVFMIAFGSLMVWIADRLMNH